jgi:hypothetical protein
MLFLLVTKVDSVFRVQMRGMEAADVFRMAMAAAPAGLRVSRILHHQYLE